jgi:hypothetical protein
VVDTSRRCHLPSQILTARPTPDLSPEAVHTPTMLTQIMRERAGPPVSLDLNSPMLGSSPLFIRARPNGRTRPKRSPVEMPFDLSLRQIGCPMTATPSQEINCDVVIVVRDRAPAACAARATARRRLPRNLPREPQPGKPRSRGQPRAFLTPKSTGDPNNVCGGGTDRAPGGVTTGRKENVSRPQSCAARRILSSQGPGPIATVAWVS